MKDLFIFGILFASLVSTVYPFKCPDAATELLVGNHSNSNQCICNPTSQSLDCSQLYTPFNLKASVHFQSFIIRNATQLPDVLEQKLAHVEVTTQSLVVLNAPVERVYLENLVSILYVLPRKVIEIHGSDQHQHYLDTPPLDLTDLKDTIETIILKGITINSLDNLFADYFKLQHLELHNVTLIRPPDNLPIISIELHQLVLVNTNIRGNLVFVPSHLQCSNSTTSQQITLELRNNLNMTNIDWSTLLNTSTTADCLFEIRLSGPSAMGMEVFNEPTVIQLLSKKASSLYIDLHEFPMNCNCQLWKAVVTSTKLRLAVHGAYCENVGQYLVYINKKTVGFDKLGCSGEDETAWKSG